MFVGGKVFLPYQGGDAFLFVLLRSFKMMKIILLLFAVVAFPSMALSADGALAQRVAELEKKLNSRWLDKVELSGVVEIEAGYTDAEGDKSSDIDLTNVELGIDVSLTDFAAAFVLFKWEDDDDGVVIDEGGISLGSIDDNGFALTLGKLYVPFGVYDSSFVADPLTLELGETREGAVVVDFATQGFYGSAYAFNSELDKAGDDDKLDAFGVKLGYALENDRLAFDVSAGYISNITSSGGFVDGLGRGTSIADQSAGATFAAIISVADVTFTGSMWQLSTVIILLPALLNLRPCILNSPMVLTLSIIPPVLL